MSDNNLTNHFIIAMPGLMDENFSQAVTYICEHDANGTFGIIINRKSGIKMEDVMAQMKIPCSETAARKSVFIGGPVQDNRGFILHRPVGRWGSSLVVNESIALTTSKDILQAIADDSGPVDSIVALGYAGWGPGQLENELAANAWLSCPAEEQIIFETPVESRWQAAADLLGVNLSLMSNDPGHA